MDSDLKKLDKKLDFLTKAVTDLINQMEVRNVDKNDYLTLDETCGFMKISKTKIKGMLARGELQFATKLGRSWRFKKSELIKYMGRI